MSTFLLGQLLPSSKHTEDRDWVPFVLHTSYVLIHLKDSHWGSGNIPVSNTGKLYTLRGRK